MLLFLSPRSFSLHRETSHSWKCVYFRLVQLSKMIAGGENGDMEWYKSCSAGSWGQCHLNRQVCVNLRKGDVIWREDKPERRRRGCLCMNIWIHQELYFGVVFCCEWRKLLSGCLCVYSFVSVCACVCYFPAKGYMVILAFNQWTTKRGQQEIRVWPALTQDRREELN